MLQTKTKKIIAIVALLSIAIVSVIIYYLFNMPHRDVQATKTDFTLSATQLVQEYLIDASKANAKYLQEDGESKVLAVSGKIFSITIDMKNQKVVMLKDSNEKAGVSCTFTEATNSSTDNLKVGETIAIKGVIRSGAGYDKDLDMYEDVIMEKCNTINKQ